MIAERLLLARVGAETFAFPIAAVLEAAEAPAVSPLALLPAGVAGQCVHRDRLLPVIDAGTLLGVPRKEPRGVLLLIEINDNHAALWVDDVLDMVMLEPHQRRPVPAGSGAAGEMLSGVADLGGMIVALVAMDDLRATVRARLMAEVA